MDSTSLSPIWSLAGDAGTLSAAEAGVTDIVRRRGHLRVETCTLHLEGTPFDAPPLFSPGSPVTVRRDGLPWFAGRVTAVPGSGDGRTESLAYVLNGPWWYLEKLVYRQAWTLHGGATQASISRAVLGQDADGTRLTSGQVIAQVLAYAIEAGAPFQIGTIEPDDFLPLDETRNVTCAQILRRMLHWHPDCVLWFDHGTEGGPTLHCRSRFNLPAAVLTVGQPPLTAVRGLTSREDLLTPAVVLYYETHEGTDLALLTDAFPAKTTGREFGGLVATIPADRSNPDAPATAPDGEVGFTSLAELPTRGGNPGQTLAQALLDARSTLVYSGSIVLTEAEPGGSPAGGGPAPEPGTTLNLLGTARAEWANMRALVVEDETRVASGTTTVSFGATEAVESSAEAGALAAALLAVQPGIVGREAGNPAAAWTRGSAERINGRTG